MLEICGMQAIEVDVEKISVEGCRERLRFFFNGLRDASRAIFKTSAETSGCARCTN
jgi:hypothetical protein